jgi:hypothetical protein
MTRITLGLLASAALLATAASALAGGSGPTEATLASTDQAMTYCQSGKMPTNDIAYIAGAPGLAQYGPGSSCVQQVPGKKTSVTKAVQVVGTTVSECKLESMKKSVAFCNAGGIGEWDIDYIAGKVGKTINGPGYGCNVNKSTSTIGNAVCR